MFATFTEPAASKSFRFTNNGATDGMISVVSAPIEFEFTAPTGLSTATRLATLAISTPEDAGATP